MGAVPGAESTTIANVRLCLPAARRLNPKDRPSAPRAMTAAASIRSGWAIGRSSRISRSFEVQHGVGCVPRVQQRLTMHDAELVIGDDGLTHRRWGNGFRHYMGDRPEPDHNVAEPVQPPRKDFSADIQRLGPIRAQCESPLKRNSRTQGPAICILEWRLWTLTSVRGGNRRTCRSRPP